MRRTPRAWGAPTLALLVALGAAFGQAAAQESSALERAVKATFLYKFAPFVEWRASAAAAPGGAPAGPFVICVQGDDALADLAARAAAGQQAGGRAIEVRRLVRVSAADGCQIAYLGGSASQSRTAALKAVASAGVLTVTDEEAGAAPRGAIHFVLRDGRVRFDIDTHAAAQQGLAISSKLLSLAAHVRSR